jgi:hypothetical protein
MTFDGSEDATQVHYVLRQMQENSSLNFDATVITKDQEGKLHSYPMKDSATPVTPSTRAMDEVAADRKFVQSVLEGLPHGSTALFMVVGDGDASTTLLTMLLLFTPNAVPMFLPAGIQQLESTDAHFRADLETYQAAVANLEGLRADSTEVDVEAIFKTVDDAYNRLVRFISTDQEKE